MQPSADTFRAEHAANEPAKALVPFGLTDRQARFLVTVMLHSGVFVGRQYAAFAGITHGQKVHDFIEKLLVRRFVTPIALGSTGRTRIFHVHHKPLYGAIGEPDNRNRRRVTIDRAIERLMVLDGVLAVTAMSVTVRAYVNGGWEVDIRVQLPDGSVIRERKKAAASSKQAAQKWAASRERVLLVHGKPKPAREDVQKIPTLKEFALRFLDGYAKANRLKPSGIASKETGLRVHLAKAFGDKRLDAAIRLLETGTDTSRVARGEIVEAAGTEGDR